MSGGSAAEKNMFHSTHQPQLSIDIFPPGYKKDSAHAAALEFPSWLKLFLFLIYKQ